MQLVLNELIKLYDHSIIISHRGELDQNAAFAAGTTQLKWPHGKHNRFPSKAVDIVPYHKRHGKLIGNPAQLETIARVEGISIASANALLREHYCVMMGAALAIAALLGVKLRWGGDWNRNHDLYDNSFDDLPHLELDE